MDPESIENKYYVAGLGLVREEQEDGSEPIDLMRTGVTLKSGKLIIEHNATDEDTGFQGFFDSEGWQRLDMANPAGELVLTVEALGELGNLGMTELFFETVEPENAEVPIGDMLVKLPDGFYTVQGPTIENGESEGDTFGTPRLTHLIPDGPELLAPAEDAAVDPEQELMMRWAPVTADLEGDPVEIIAYQLIIEKDEEPHLHRMGKMGLSTYLPPTVTSVAIPGGFLEADASYEWEVLAIEVSGNQTLSSGAFTTGEVEETPDPEPDADPPDLKAAKLIIEHNATDEDTGFQGFIDSEGWRDLEVTGPGGQAALRLEGKGELGTLGLTELFFETVEPENADVSVAEMLAKLPAGEYTISGTSMQNGESGGPTSGTAWLTHSIPAGAELLSPAEDAVVRADDVTVRWSPVTETVDGGAVNIIAYQLIIEEDEGSQPDMIGKNGLQVYVASTVTSVRVPRGILEPGTPYEWEVLAIEASGNQTLVSGAFETANPLVIGMGPSALTWPSIEGRPYDVYMRAAMTDGEWSVVDRVEATGSTATYDISTIRALHPQGYFRVLEIEP